MASDRRLSAARWQSSRHTPFRERPAPWPEDTCPSCPLPQIIPKTPPGKAPKENPKTQIGARARQNRRARTRHFKNPAFFLFCLLDAHADFICHLRIQPYPFHAGKYRRFNANEMAPILPLGGVLSPQIPKHSRRNPSPEAQSGAQAPQNRRAKVQPFRTPYFQSHGRVCPR